MEEMLSSKVTDYVEKNLNTYDSDMTIMNAVKKMIAEKLDSVLVVEKDSIVGLVTNEDILRKVVADGRDPTTTTLDDIKSYPIIEIDKDSTMIDAILLMNKHDIRRLLVKDNNKPFGMITRKQIVGNIGEQYISLPELEMPNQIRCPYCDSVFPDKESLSKHIDDVHIGRGVLDRVGA